MGYFSEIYWMRVGLYLTGLTTVDDDVNWSSPGVLPGVLLAAHIEALERCLVGALVVAVVVHRRLVLELRGRSASLLVRKIEQNVKKAHAVTKIYIECNVFVLTILKILKSVQSACVYLRKNNILLLLNIC